MLGGTGAKVVETICGGSITVSAAETGVVTVTGLYVGWMNPLITGGFDS